MFYFFPSILETFFSGEPELQPGGEAIRLLQQVSGFKDSAHPRRAETMIVQIRWCFRISRPFHIAHTIYLRRNAVDDAFRHTGE